MLGQKIRNCRIVLVGALGLSLLSVAGRAVGDCPVVVSSTTTVNAYRARTQVHIDISPTLGCSYSSATGAAQTVVEFSGYWDEPAGECGQNREMYLPPPFIASESGVNLLTDTVYTLGEELGVNAGYSYGRHTVSANGIYTETDMIGGLSNSFLVYSPAGSSHWLELFAIPNASSEATFTAQLASGTGCGFVITEEIDVLTDHWSFVNRNNMGSNLAVADQNVPLGQFVEIVYRFYDGSNASLSTVIQQGLAGQLGDATPVKYGLYSGLVYGSQTNGNGYSGTLTPTVTIPTGAVKIEISQKNRAVAATGDVVRQNGIASCHDDLLPVLAALGSAVGQLSYVPEADLNFDGSVDVDDLEILQSVGCPADFNCDSVVDDGDFGYFATAYNEYLSEEGDFNGDGVTDDADYIIFSDAYSNFACPLTTTFELP